MTAPVTISVAGRLARDPEPKRTANGNDMALATIAVDLPAGRDAEPETWWLSLMAFGRTSGELAKHRKGDRLTVMGSLQRSRYRGRDGEERESWTVLCDAVLGPRSPRPSGQGQRQHGGDRAPASNGAAGHGPPPHTTDLPPTDLPPISLDDDLPF